VKRYRVRFSALARAQIEELQDYISDRADPTTALRYVERI
jgi:plasmid stabilization system protein ParE